MKQKIKLLLIVTLVCHMACTNKENVPQRTSADTQSTHIDSVAKTLFVRAKYHQSASLYTQIYVAAKKSQNKSREAYAYEMLGNIATRQGQFENALSWYFQAHRTYQNLQDTLSKAWINNHIGYVYVSIGQIDNGMYYYQNADELASMITDSTKTKRLYGVLYMNISGVYLRRRNYEAFFQKAFKSLKYLEDDSTNFAINYNNLGIAYKSLGEYDKAKYWLQKGLDIYLALGDKQQLSMIYGNLGLIYMDQKSYAKAEKFLLNELELGIQINSVSAQKDGHYDLASVYKETGDLRKALDHYIIAYELNEQMFSEQISESISSLENKHNVEIREKEIEIGKLQLRKKEKESELWKAIVRIVVPGILVVSILALLFARATKKLKKAHKVAGQSMRYAQYIQNSFLPNGKKMDCILQNYFVIYSPKDVVSGDFYWVNQQGDNMLFAVGDCMGHGVPAALLTVFGFRLMDECYRTDRSFVPDVVVNHINQKIAITFSEQEGHRREGMELVVCTLNKKTLMLEYAGSNLPLYLVRNGEIQELKTEKFYLGEEERHETQSYQFQLMSGDKLYCASDGYHSQYGGPLDKKFSKRQFKDFLQSLDGKPMKEQETIVIQTLLAWQKKAPQTDDILVMGIEV